MKPSLLTIGPYNLSSHIQTALQSLLASIFSLFSSRHFGISKLSSESSSTGQTMKSAQLQAPHHPYQCKFLPLQDNKGRTDHPTMTPRSHTSHRDQNNPTERATLLALIMRH